MQTFLASDVVHAERVAPLIRDALDKNGVKGQQITGSRFMTDISWLAPADRRLAPGPQREPPAPPAPPGRPRPACTATA